jgi:cytochrome c oxidase cbb3-type subunit 3
MKSWKADLTPTEIQNVSTYILSLNGTTPLAPKDPQGDLEEPAQPKGSEANEATASL